MHCHQQLQSKSQNHWLKEIAPQQIVLYYTLIWNVNDYPINTEQALRGGRRIDLLITQLWH